MSKIFKKFILSFVRFNNVGKRQSSNYAYNVYSCVKFNKVSAFSNVVFGFSLANLFKFKEKKYEFNKTDVKLLISQGRQLLQEGNVVEAFELYTLALEKAQSAHSDSDDIHLIKQQLGIIEMELEHYDKAEQLLSEVVEFYKRQEHDETDLRLIYVCLKLARTYQQLQKYSKAEELYGTCYERLKPKVADALKKKDEETLFIWMKTLVGNGHYRIHRMQYDRALAYFKEAQDLILKFRGEISEQNVLLLKNLGAVYFQKGDLGTAVVHLERASEIGKHLPGMVQLSSVYLSLGNIYLKQGLLKEAENNCNQAYKNATRHQNKDILAEAEVCLKEIEKLHQQ